MSRDVVAVEAGIRSDSSSSSSHSQPPSEDEREARDSSTAVVLQDAPLVASAAQTTLSVEDSQSATDEAASSSSASAKPDNILTVTVELGDIKQSDSSSIKSNSESEKRRLSNDKKEEDKKESELQKAEEKLSKLFTQLTDKPSAEDRVMCEIEGMQVTERSEIWAWYCYDWANSPVSGVGITLMLPIMLMYYAEAYACSERTKYGCDWQGKAIHDSFPKVPIFGGLKPSSYAAAMISISGIVQVFGYMTFGALADYARYQQYGLYLCAALGSTLTVSWVFLDGADSWLAAGWLGIFTIVLFGLSIVFYNAYLPLLVDRHWLTLRALRAGRSQRTLQKIRQILSDDISQIGFATGYCATFFVILTAICILVLLARVDTRFEMTGNSGLHSNKKANRNGYALSRAIEEDNDEFWLQSVTSLTVGYSQTDGIYSLRLSYHSDELNGDTFGEPLPAQFGGDSNLTANSPYYNYSAEQSTSDVRIERLLVPDSYICKVEMYLHSENAALKGVQFTLKNGTRSRIYGVSANDSSAELQVVPSHSVSYCGRSYTLGGMNAAVGYNKSLDTASGKQFVVAVAWAFVDKRRGQFSHFWSQRVSMLFVGIWWMAFSLLSFWYLNSRDGPPLPEQIDINDIRKPMEARADRLLLTSDRHKGGAIGAVAISRQKSVKKGKKIKSPRGSFLGRMFQKMSVSISGTKKSGDLTAVTQIQTSVETVATSSDKLQLPVIGSNEEVKEDIIDGGDEVLQIRSAAMEAAEVKASHKEDEEREEVVVGRRSQEAHFVKVNPLTFSYVRLFVTLKEARHFPHLFRFLLTYFMWSDGLGTMVACGILFARDEIHMDGIELILLALLVQVTAIGGAIAFVWTQKRFDASAKTMLLFHIGCLGFLPMYAMIGMLPNATFGMVTRWEMYLFVGFYGLHLGSIQSYGRSLFASMIPIGKESEMFAFYEVTDKGSSWIGPAMVAAVSNVSSMRWALIYIVLFFWVPFPLIYYYIDIDEGVIQSGRKLRQHNPRSASAMLEMKSLKDVLADANEDAQNLAKELGYTK